MATAFVGTLGILVWGLALVSFMYMAADSFADDRLLRGCLSCFAAAFLLATTVAILSTFDDAAAKGLCRAGYQQWASGGRHRTKVWVCTQWDAEAEPPR